MSHVSLYRKYRPATFAAVTGQEHVTRTLANAIESGKVSHAYLFAGSRGTGKTSTAKLLAKALNCAAGPGAEPCGKCESCTSISAGTSLDVVEMDAASNRGIDDIREIRDRVAYSPVEGKWRVYILDEAHMLTKEASNAFLKVLEEPPAHVIFVLCTTEAPKVLPTIQSRCQRFEFRRPDAGMVFDVVKRVAAAEEIDIDDAGLTAIARSAGGSFRDAIGALDQLATYCEKKVALADVLAMLGTVEADLLFEAVDIVADGDARGAILFIDRLAERGRDFGQFAGELIAHLRNIFLLQQLDDHPDGVISASEEEIARLRGQARQLAPHQLYRFIELLTAAQAAIKQGSDARLQLELAFIAITRPEADRSTKSLLYRLEQLEKGRGGMAASAAERRPAGEPAAVDVPVSPPAPESAESGPAAPAAEVTIDKISRAWSVILDLVKKEKIPLAAQLQEARPLALNGAKLVIGFAVEFNRDIAQRPENRAVLAGALKEITGADLKVKCVVNEAPAAHPPPPKTASGEEEVIAMLKEELDAEEIT